MSRPNLPPELRLIDGKSPGAVTLPDHVSKRIPHADWLANPDNWSKSRFIQETSDYLYDVYGIGDDQNKHTLAILAEQMDLYIQCSKGIMNEGIISEFNDGKTIGPNPYITVRDKTLTQIVRLMNELGLTPKSRLANTNKRENSPAARFLAGPLAR